MRETPTVRWRDLVGPSWEGRCVYCGETLTAADWERQQVVASKGEGPRGPYLLALCLQHLRDGPGSPGWKPAVKALARATAFKLAGLTQDGEVEP